MRLKTLISKLKTYKKFAIKCKFCKTSKPKFKLRYFYSENCFMNLSSGIEPFSKLQLCY